MNAVTRTDIFNAMHALKLTGMINAYDEILSNSIKRKAPASYSLHQLLKSEVKTRKLKSIKKARVKAAKFPENKDLNDFIFSDTPVKLHGASPVVFTCL